MRNIKYIKSMMGLLAASVAVSGCTVDRQAASNIGATQALATQAHEQAAHPLPAANKAEVKMHDGVFVGTRSSRNENGDPLPSKFERPGGITIVRTNPIGLREVAAIVTEQTKIPLVVAAATPGGNGASGSSSSGATAQDATAGGARGQSTAPSLAAGPIPAGFPLDQALAEIRGGGSGGQTGGAGSGVFTASSEMVSESAIPMNYAGPLSGLLDIVSAHFNVAWRYEKGKIVLDQVVTRSFDVPALPIAASLSFDLSSKTSNQANGNSSQSGSEAKTSSETDVFKEVDNAIGKLVGSGSTYSINKATGVVTVTANPATVARVATYIQGLNERLSDQVALSVKIYAVTLNDANSFDLDVAGIFNKAGKYGINLGTGAAATAAPALAGADAGAGVGWALLNGDWKGTNALVNALATAGKVSEVQNINTTALNGIPVPIQVGEQRDYIRKIETTTDSDGNITYSIDPAEISTGFSMHLAPRIQRDGDVLLQYGLNISELTGADDGFDRFSVPDGPQLQLKRVKQRNFIQQARIPNNATLVLAGFDQIKSRSTKSGTGIADFSLLGGGRSASVEHEIIVIAITPTVLKK
jgi:type IVB pilus formation R64 PilN family outer membrane protein